MSTPLHALPPSRWKSRNPVTGCTRISEGCRHCYAERWRGIPGHHFEHGFDLQLRPERLEVPLHWRTPRREMPPGERPSEQDALF